MIIMQRTFTAAHSFTDNKATFHCNVTMGSWTQRDRMFLFPSHFSVLLFYNRSGVDDLSATGWRGASIGVAVMRARHLVDPLGADACSCWQIDNVQS